MFSPVSLKGPNLVFPGPKFLKRISSHSYIVQLNARSLLSRPYIRILAALESQGPLRFNQVRNITGLNPATVDRILKAFVREQYIWASILPAEGSRLPLLYEITTRGHALLEIHRAQAKEAERHVDLLGSDLVREIKALG